MIKSELNKECGIRLKECLNNSNMTQNELSSLTGYTQQYISNIVVGQKPMTIKAAKLFSKHLHVREAYLLCESNHKTMEDMHTAMITGINEMEECILRYAHYNGLTIESCIIITNTGEQLVKKENFGVSVFDKTSLLGKQIVNGKECTIADIKFKIKIYNKTFIVDADRIFECFNFITNYLQVQRQRLYNELERKEKYLNLN